MSLKHTNDCIYFQLQKADRVIDYTKFLRHIAARCGSSTKSSFINFVKKSFEILSPGTNYLHNWHVNLICKTLKAVEDGKISRLLINMPPRHLKSTIVNIAWPAWLLGRNPALRIISASYSQRLSSAFSLNCKRIIDSKWYQNLFPKTIIGGGENQAHKFVTTKNGMRFATSVGGTLTGEGGDILIIDDPHTPLHANSSKHRKKVTEWFDKTFSTRLNDPKNGKIVVIMQRLHEHDLSGHILKHKLKDSRWHHLSIPLIADRNINFQVDDHEYKMAQGEVLQEARIAKAEANLIRQTIGSHAFHAQYQQEPLSNEGSVIRSEWMSKFNPKIEGVDIQNAKGFEACFQSWDCAFKVSDSSDYSVCVTFGIKGGKIFIIDIIRAKLEFPDLKKLVKLQYEKYNPQSILIEDMASGQVLIQELERSYTIPIYRIKPKVDKLSRIMNILSFFETGKLMWPDPDRSKDSIPWYKDAEHEVLNFPNVTHDDQIDAISQFLNWWQSRQTSQSFNMRIL